MKQCRILALYMGFLISNLQADLGPLERSWLDHARAAYETGGITEATKEIALAYTNISEEGQLNLTHSQTFDHWCQAIWREAQFGRGSKDQAWAAFLYDWINSQSKAEGRLDWTCHVRGNLVTALSNVGKLARVRELLLEHQDLLIKEGFSHDTSRFPSRGVWFPPLFDVLDRKFPLMMPNGKHVIYWQRKETGNNPEEPIILDNMEAATIRAMARSQWSAGEWQQGMEKLLWLLDWADEVNRREDDTKVQSKPVRDQVDERQRVVLNLAKDLTFLGYTERATELVREALADPKPSKYHDIPRYRLRYFQAESLALKGLATANTVTELKDILVQMKSNPNADATEQGEAKFTLAKVFDSINQTTEADALLKELVTVGEYRGQRTAVNIYQVHRSFGRKNYDGLEAKLNELLLLTRRLETKLEELSLFRLYAKVSFETGQLAKGLAAQREVLRLIRAFNLYPLEAIALAQLAVFQQRAGDPVGAKATAAAANGQLARVTLGRDSTAEVKGLLSQVTGAATPGPLATVSPQAQMELQLQPRIATSMAIGRHPARAIFSLSNPTNQLVSGVLSFADEPVSLSWDDATATAKIEFHPSGKHPLQPQQNIQLHPGEVATFEVSVPLEHRQNGESALQWNVSGSKPSQALWRYDPAETDVDRGVVDAGVFASSPFYLVPIYHHLKMKDGASVNLRIVASQPTRIELYDGAGRFAMADAEGNGSLAESGDQLGWDLDRDGWPEITFDEQGEAKILLYAQALQPIPAAGVEITVEWKIDGKWVPVATDQLMLFNPK